MPYFASSRQGCILVIDDSPEILILDRIVLETAGYRVLTAASGEDALALIQQKLGIDLVLLDYRLSDMCGSEFLERLATGTPDFLAAVPVIYHTGMEALERGKATGIIPKVTDIKNFLAEVNRFMVTRKLRAPQH